MDRQINKKERIPHIPVCNYECNKCVDKNSCFVYAFEFVGRKSGESAEGNSENYNALLKELETTLKQTIDSVKNRADSKILSLNNDNVRTNPDFPPVMLLTKEFADRTYGLILEIRSYDKIDVRILEPLRELQFNHTEVMTEICRGIAVLLSKEPSKETPRIHLKNALSRLNRCSKALMTLSQFMPDKKDEILEILDISSRIECEIQMQLL